MQVAITNRAGYAIDCICLAVETSTLRPMTESTSLYSYRFGQFELQPSERRLLAAGVPAVVEPRAFDVLVALVERAGHLVTKEELFSLVWPKLIVEDTNLHVQVSALRKILGPAAIATVPGRGYRFTLELTRERLRRISAMLSVS